MFKLMTLIFLVFSSVSAEISDLKMGVTPAISPAMVIKQSSLDMKGLDSTNPLAGGFNDLIAYIMPSPYQEGSGSCLYMSHTGIIEWWMNRLENRTGSDKYDLSERYYMSLKTERLGSENIDNWRTDNIERLNAVGKFYRNEDYRFTKGWWKKVDGKRVASFEGVEKAKYSTRFNWISYRSELPEHKAIKVPQFKREVILVNKDKDQWSVGEAPLDIVEKVKAALVKNQAPVIVIYNHQGFWHANIVFGFNDTASTNGCEFTSNFKKNMDKRALEIDQEAKEAKTQKRRRSLIAKAKKFRAKGNTVDKRFAQIGGCKEKGVFYVRDSIYPSKDMPLYDYDLENEDEERNLNSELILREYDWLTTSANHVFQILPRK